MQTETKAAAPARGKLTLATRGGATRKTLTRKAAEKATEAEPSGEGVEASFPAADPGAEPAVVAPRDTESPATAAELPAPGAELPPAAVSAADEPDSPAAEAAAEPTAQTEPMVAPAEPAADQRPAIAESPREPSSGPSDEAVPEPGPTGAAAPAWSSEDERALQAMLARRKAAGYQRRGRDVGGQLIRVGEIAPNPGTVVATIVGLVAERGTVGRAELIDAMAGAAFSHPKARPSDRGWCQGYVAGAVRDGFLALADEAAGNAALGQPSPAAEASTAASPR